MVRCDFQWLKCGLSLLCTFFSNIHLVLVACKNVDPYNIVELFYACNRLAGQEVTCFLQHLSFEDTQSRMKLLLEGVGGSIISKQQNCMHL